MFFVMLYFGGYVPAYRAARKNGHGWLHAILVDTVMWPADVGWELAARYCASEKE